VVVGSRPPIADRPLWRCPSCGRTFAAPRQTHACAALGTLDELFLGCDPHVRPTFDRVLEIVQELGPVEVLPEKTRIALHVRISFAALIPRRRWLDGHVVLDRVVTSDRFRRVEVYSPRNVLHAFRLHSPQEVDGEVASWLEAAYRVGQQRHRI
jgi:hypothetical protein